MTHAIEQISSDLIDIARNPDCVEVSDLDALLAYLDGNMSLEVAEAIFTERTSAALTATCGLYDYCVLKRKAMIERLAGNIEGAMSIERHCQVAYIRIAKRFRW